MDSVEHNLSLIKERIDNICRKIGRRTEEVTLVAVSKKVDAIRIMSAYSAGHRDFGESYWQEAKQKLSELPQDIRWHYIGHLQSNKAKYVAGVFALIHSIDSCELAQLISNRAANTGCVADVLIEVKLTDEPSKTGIELKELDATIETVNSLPGLRLKGLMGMPPVDATGETARPYFRRLKQLFDRLPEKNKIHLSMGMSGDFIQAIEEGATIVRIGSAIFGPR